LNYAELSLFDINSQVQSLWDVNTINLSIFIRHLPKLISHKSNFFTWKVLKTIQRTINNNCNLQMDTLNNNLSILDMETLEPKAFLFLLWKIFFFLTPISPSISTSNIWLSLYDLRRTFNECSWKIVYDSGHLQIFITIDMSFGQYKMSNPTWFLPKSSSSTTSLGSHVITHSLLTTKTPSTSLTSHLVSFQLQCLHEGTFYCCHNHFFHEYVGR
jgi:hypothetical protein